MLCAGNRWENTVKAADLILGFILHRFWTYWTVIKSKMDPFGGLTPRQPASIYRNLVLIGTLGIAEVTTGLVCTCAEIAG